eukprot:scaffold1313_cov349-Pavlova_lutheri.AAC.5
MDLNVAQDIMPVVASKKVVARGMWTGEHRVALLCQCCVESCNPFTKQGNISTMGAWNCLPFALRADPNRMFDGFSLPIDSLRRHVGTALTSQKTRNQQARAATGRGGTSVHTDEEELVQHLLEQHKAREAERSASKAGRVARTTKLDTEGWVRLSCQMDTHKKKRRSTASSPSTGSAPHAKSAAEWNRAKTRLNCIFQSAVEESVRMRAGKEWMRFYTLHEDAPTKWPDPGSHEGYIKRALQEHRDSIAVEKIYEKDESVATTSQMEDEGNVDV